MPKHREASRRPRRSARRLVWSLVVLGAALPFLAHLYIRGSVRDPIYTGIANVPYCRVALVLGAGITPNGNPHPVLKDRLDTAIALYNTGKVEKLLMTGDNRFSHYNEPRRMCEYAIKHGVPADDVVMDYAGRRTYDSVYRAKHIFGLSKVAVVTQLFHLDRALFLCQHLGVDAFGVAADVPGHSYPRGAARELGASVSAIIDVYVRHPRPVMGKRERI